MARIEAVLTGDIIGSTRADPRDVDRAMQTIDATSHLLSKAIGGDTRFTRFRGDGWQIHLRLSNHCLHACILIIAALRASGAGLASRISVGLGEVTFPGSTGLSDASGSAFTTSGQQLDQMQRGEVLAIQGPGITMLHQAIFGLVDERTSRWSGEQAEAVALALHPDRPNQSQIADRLGITRQAVQARLAGAGYLALEKANAAFVKEVGAQMDMEHSQDA
jgi:hypothetical protein